MTKTNLNILLAMGKDRLTGQTVNPLEGLNTLQIEANLASTEREKTTNNNGSQSIGAHERDRDSIDQFEK